MEQYVNSATTTLSAAITTTGQTSIVVTSATGFPTIPQFRIMIMGEILLVTAITGGGVTWTVTRGVEGSQPITCSSGVAVDHVMTAGALDQIRIDSLATGTYANLPTPGTNRTGDLYIPTDSFYDLIRYNGSTWDHFRNGKLLTPPDTSFSWDNQSSATTTAIYGGAIVFISTGTSGQLNVRYRTAPATPYTITAGYLPHYTSTNASIVGLGWRNSSSGKVVVGGTCYNSGYSFRMSKWTTATSFSADYSTTNTPPAMFHGPIVWLQIFDDGTNRGWKYSANGTNWTTIRSDTRTDFLTPDQVHFCIGDATADLGITLLHWQVA